MNELKKSTSFSKTRLKKKFWIRLKEAVKLMLKAASLLEEILRIF